MTGDFFYWKQCKLEMRTTSSQHGKKQKPKAIVNLEILPNENVFQNKGEHFLHQNYTTKKKKKLKFFKQMKPGVTKKKLRALEIILYQ